MHTKQRGLLATALLALTTLLLAGCGGPNLFDQLRSPWSLGCCGTVVVILDVIFLLELAGSTRSLADKVLWALLIIFFPVLGCILYYLFGRS